MATKQEMLTAVETAINALVTGGVKEYSIGSRTFKKNELPELRQWRKELKREIIATSGKRTSFVEF